MLACQRRRGVTTREALLARVMVVFGRAASHKLKLKMEHTYPLEQAAEAQTARAGRRTTGKVLLLP